MTEAGRIAGERLWFAKTFGQRRPEQNVHIRESDLVTHEQMTNHTKISCLYKAFKTYLVLYHNFVGCYEYIDTTRTLESVTIKSQFFY